MHHSLNAANWFELNRAKLFRADKDVQPPDQRDFPRRKRAVRQPAIGLYLAKTDRIYNGLVEAIDVLVRSRCVQVQKGLPDVFRAGRLFFRVAGGVIDQLVGDG